MCDPVSIGIATFALGATQSVMQHVGTNKAFEANQEASNLSYAQESNAIARQEAQTDRAYSENVLDTAITTLKAQGEVAAGASQQGLASSSIVRAINADMFGIGRQATVEEQNYRTEKIDLGERRYGAALQRNARNRSAPRSGLLQLGVNLAGNALSGYNSYSSAKKA